MFQNLILVICMYLGYMYVFRLYVCKMVTAVPSRFAVLTIDDDDYTLKKNLRI
jgi:hypothetical protein